MREAQGGGPAEGLERAGGQGVQAPAGTRWEGQRCSELGRASSIWGSPGGKGMSISGLQTSSVSFQSAEMCEEVKLRLQWPLKRSQSQGRGERGHNRPEHAGTGRGRATKTGRQSPERSRRARKRLWGQGMKRGFLPSQKGREGKAGVRAGRLCSFISRGNKRPQSLPLLEPPASRPPLGKHRAC